MDKDVKMPLRQDIILGRHVGEAVHGQVASRKRSHLQPRKKDQLLLNDSGNDDGYVPNDDSADGSIGAGWLGRIIGRATRDIPAIIDVVVDAVAVAGTTPQGKLTMGSSEAVVTAHRSGDDDSPRFFLAGSWTCHQLIRFDLGCIAGHQSSYGDSTASGFQTRRELRGIHLKKKEVDEEKIGLGVNWELRKAPSGPDPIHHNAAHPKNPTFTSPPTRH
ncbi:hypothetical protein POM88_047802 [Heracleum sosnowskyi]|uniref:Uncharacterized protein n=1 Tax=Heracleum sosnowskyi TaxID=360622 RepID=A0AAD8GTX7_9APIA|nr:hypothetical protein POM88_047802 [Heracleum sosnowskyi]